MKKKNNKFSTRWVQQFKLSVIKTMNCNPVYPIRAKKQIAHFPTEFQLDSVHSMITSCYTNVKLTVRQHAKRVNPTGTLLTQFMLNIQQQLSYRTKPKLISYRARLRLRRMRRGIRLYERFAQTPSQPQQRIILQMRQLPAHISTFYELSW